MSYSTGLWDSVRTGVGAFYFDLVTLSANFSATPVSGNAPLSVSFTDLTSGSPSPTSWLWDFGDLSPLISVQNPTHIYSSSGTYTVTESATNAFGTSIASFINYINVNSAAPTVVSAGHIGAFYFGPIYADVSADTAIIQVSGVIPEVIAIQAVSATVNIDYAFITVSGVIPEIYSVRDLIVDFVGVPRAGFSPLIVDFTAYVTFGGDYYNRYYVKDYIWYFDYDNNPTVTEVTSSPTITHIYNGYAGKKFTVKLCVNIASK